MKEDIRLASPDLLTAIRKCFESLATPWSVESVNVNEAGTCVSDASVQLLSVRPGSSFGVRCSRKPQVDLTDEERSELASAIAALSRSREHHMQNFDG